MHVTITELFESYKLIENRPSMKRATLDIVGDFLGDIIVSLKVKVNKKKLQVKVSDPP